MAVVSKAQASSTVFDLKSATLTLVALVLKTTDWAELERELDERFGNVPDFFDHDPVSIDLTPVCDAATDIDFAALIALLRRHKMVPVAAKGGSVPQMEAARAAGLVEAPDSTGNAVPARVAPAATPEVMLTEVIREVPVASAALVVDKPLRSGQQVYARGGDLIVLAVVSFGAEVIADGSIHVYAPLRGRAIAGAKGNTNARIYTTCMEPQLVSIAGFYRTTETELPADVLGKAAQVRLDGERLVVEALKL
jgi:septum site-determining protein MinC